MFLLWRVLPVEGARRPWLKVGRLILEESVRVMKKPVVSLAERSAIPGVPSVLSFPSLVLFLLVFLLFHLLVAGGVLLLGVTFHVFAFHLFAG